MNRLRLAAGLEGLALAYLALILFTLPAGRIELGPISFGGHATKIVPYLLLLGWGARRLREGRLSLGSPLLAPGGAFLLVAFVASLGSPFPYSALQTALGLLSALLFYLYLYNLRPGRRAATLLWGAFLLGHLWLCGVGLSQVLAGEPGERIRGTFNHFNMLAGYQMLALPALLHLSLRVEGWKRRGLWGLALVSLYLLFCAYSRAALLGALVAAGVAVALGRGRTRRVAAGSLLALLILALPALPTLSTRFMETGSELAGPAPLSRARLWQGTLEMIAAHPERLVFGQGWGEAFGHELARTRVGFQHPLLAERYTHAHNLYLQLLLAYGAAGLVAFLVMMAVWLRSVWPRRHGPEAFLLAGGAAFLAHGFFEVLLTTFNLPLTLAALLALARPERRP